MKINPILMQNFSLKNSVSNNQNKTLTPSLKTLSHDTFTPSFGEIEGGIFENYDYDFKKEYKEIKKLLKNRPDFTLRERRAIAGTVKYEYGFEKLLLAGKKPKTVAQEMIFENKMRRYTDLAKEMIPRKRFSANTIVRILRIDRSAENLFVEKLLVQNKNFPSDRIVPFMLSARDNKCDLHKMQDMLCDGVSSEKRLIQETKTV